MMGNLNPKTTIFGEHMTNNEKIRHSQKQTAKKKTRQEYIGSNYKPENESKFTRY